MSNKKIERLLEEELCDYKYKIIALESKKDSLIWQRDRLIRCSREIPLFLKYINLILRFFGYKAKASSNVLNQVDIYGLKTNSLYTKVKIEKPVYFDFKGINGKNIICSFDNYDGKFEDGVCEVSCGNSSIKLYYEDVFDKCSSIYLTKENMASAFTSNILDIGYNHVTAVLKNQYNEQKTGNGEYRSISYYTYDKKNGILPTVMCESCNKGFDNCVAIDAYNDVHSIIESSKLTYVGGTNQRDDIKINNLSIAETVNLQFKLVTHPRNKETIEHLINEFDKDYPGIKEFIAKKFPLYRKIMETEYDKNQYLTALVERIIDKSCDIKEKGKYFDYFIEKQKTIN